MSTQSGIVANKDLLERVNKLAQEGASIVATIQKDSVEISYSRNFNTFAELKSYIDSNGTKACYVFFRYKEAVQFVSFTPDNAPVREKMVYASSKNTLVRQIGSNNLASQLFVTDPEDFTENLWNPEEDQSSDNGSSDLSTAHGESDANGGRRERPLVSMHTAASTPLSFEINSSKPVGELLEESNTLCFRIDEKSEEVLLFAKKQLASAAEVVKVITFEHPSYTLYQPSKDRLFFIYSCPSGSRVKQRMMYAANKQGFVKHLQEEEELVIVNSIEVGDPGEIDESAFQDSVTTESAQEPSTPRFRKPKGPGRRHR